MCRDPVSQRAAHLPTVLTGDRSLVTEKELEETPDPTASAVYGAYTMDIGLQGNTVKVEHGSSRVPAWVWRSRAVVNRRIETSGS